MLLSLKSKPRCHTRSKALLMSQKTIFISIFASSVSKIHGTEKEVGLQLIPHLYNRTDNAPYHYFANNTQKGIWACCCLQ